MSITNFLTPSGRIKSFFSDEERAYLFAAAPGAKTIPEALYSLKHDIKHAPTCKMCGSEVSFQSFTNGYNKYCSRSCNQKCPEHQAKLKASIMKKYGVQSIAHSLEIIEKKKLTNLQKYGAENPFQSEKIKKKIKETNLIRHGVEYISQSLEIKQKIEKTNLERHGVKSHLQLESTKEKRKQTNLERYGVEYGIQLEKFKQKRVKTNQEAFLPIRLETIRQTENIIPLWDLSEYDGCKKKYQWQHIICGHKFLQDIDDGKMPRCPKCFGNISKPHRLLLDKLIKIHPSLRFIVNDRTQISPLELDIWFPEHQIAIEINGAYWHQDVGDKHVVKTKLCQDIDIQLLHFWDFEIDRDTDLVAHLVMAKLGFNQHKVGARKLVLRDISWSEAKVFLDLHHLQGAGAPNRAAGLYFNDELLACAVIGKARYSKKDEQELYRFCVKRGYSLPGALSRLIKHIRDPNKDLISYADRRYSNGSGYLAAGFKIIGITPPSYIYARGDERISRVKAQKHKLQKLLGEKFDATLSEHENMLAAGYLKLDDCGTIKLHKNKTL